MNGLGNGLVQFDNTSEGVDGLDFLQTSPSPTSSQAYRDPRRGASRRPVTARRPAGLHPTRKQRHPADVVTQNPFPLAGCFASTRPLAMSRASAPAVQPLAAAVQPAAETDAGFIGWPSLPHRRHQARRPDYPWSGCWGRWHQHPKTISIPAVRHPHLGRSLTLEQNVLYKLEGVKVMPVADPDPDKDGLPTDREIELGTDPTKRTPRRRSAGRLGGCPRP